MGCLDQSITDRWAVYNGDCLEVMPSFPDGSIDYSIYSPPFGGLYHYSSSLRDLSNCKDYDEFLVHYDLVIAEIQRLTAPGGLTSIHCMDFTNGVDMRDFPGDIIRLHEKHGFIFHDRKTIWKEPLKEAIRTRALSLRHSQLIKDSSICRSALPDYVVTMRKAGASRAPIPHKSGLLSYAGELDPVKRARLGYLPIPEEILAYAKTWKGHPNENPFSHWVWRRYASSVWDDLRSGHILKHKEARESEEEKHVHPLWLDCIERCLTLWSNPGDKVLTPFAGVGSEAYKSVDMDRKAIAIDLKPSFYRQMLSNLSEIGQEIPDQEELAFEEVPA